MIRALALTLAALWALTIAPLSASAQTLEAIPITEEDTALDLTGEVDYRTTDGQSIQVSTALDEEGLVRRIEVLSQRAEAIDPGAAGGPDAYHWVVFALTNAGDRQIDRLLVAPHYRLVGSGIFRPDLGQERLIALTPSQGIRPDNRDAAGEDGFLITLDPGATVTFVGELTGPDLPQLYLWETDAYKDTSNALSLYHGIVLGIAGLLAVVLTIIFVVKGAVMFPAAAVLAWAVLAYLLIDFGFWSDIAGLPPENLPTWRAGTEIVLAATIIIFLYAYLALGRWHARLNWLGLAWLAGLVGVGVILVRDPSLAAGIARGSAIATAGLGLLGILYLSIRAYDRAIMLAPTWLLLGLWMTAMGLALRGQVTGDLAAPALAGGLTLIVLLIGFTVMQHAFAGGALVEGLISDGERKALALMGSGDAIWDWDVGRDRIYVSSEIETTLGVERGALQSAARKWLPFLHPNDRDRFRATLDTLIDRRRGRCIQDFRMRTGADHYRWMRLRARPIVGGDGEVLRCVGTLADVTSEREGYERLLHDAVHDNLTGLPNRELFADRLGRAMERARIENLARPTALVVDIDRFVKVNEAFGHSVADSVLLTVARRLQRVLKPQDTLGRLSGDMFGIVLLSETEPAKIAKISEGLRRAVRQPVTFGNREIVLTASVGIAAMDKRHEDATDLVRDAETAMRAAKRQGMDRIEAFTPAMRGDSVDRLTLEADLRRALDRQEITILYQPIVDLSDNTVAGFEALMRWDHPKLGRLTPGDFLALAEETDLIAPLGLFALQQTAKNIADWQTKAGGRFVFGSVNVSSRQLLSRELVNDVKNAIVRNGLPEGALRLEVTESLVMQNPEFSAGLLHQMRDLGASLSLDDFGTGYSSLAYLQRFPFQTLKIDRSFVQRNGPKRDVLLRSIVGLAHDLGLDVVAEGAETLDEVNELHDLGCEYAQGFIFGTPMSVEEALKALLDQSRIAPRRAAATADNDGAHRDAAE